MNTSRIINRLNPSMAIGALFSPMTALMMTSMSPEVYTRGYFTTYFKILGNLISGYAHNTFVDDEGDLVPTPPARWDQIYDAQDLPEQPSERWEGGYRF